MNIEKVIFNKNCVNQDAKKPKGATLPQEAKKAPEIQNSKGLEALGNYNKAAIQRFDPDERIIAYDGWLEGKNLREEMRERIFSRSAAILNDKNLQLKQLDPKDASTQLLPNSKYKNASKIIFNPKTSSREFMFQDLKDMPDLNGLRGKNPLFGKSISPIVNRVQTLMDSGIKNIIDLRSTGEITQKAMSVVEKSGIGYLNFPVEDRKWTKQSLDKITEFIDAVNKGDFYLGCANGQSRTDLACAINYCFNKNAKSVPDFYYGSNSSASISVKENIGQILNIIKKKNPDIVKAWGWSDCDEFLKESSKRLLNVVHALHVK